MDKQNTLEELLKHRYAHRGLHHKPDVPENSLLAFGKAADLGFGIEFDVHMTRDGKLAVIHDSGLKRVTTVRSDHLAVIPENAEIACETTVGSEGIIEDMTLEEATKAAEEEGFRIKQGKDVYSSDYAEGRVCLQDPAPGTDIPKEGTITINLSKGSKEGLVPNVVGMQEEDVEAFLKEHGYVLGNVKIETSPEKEGMVLEQSPVAGTTLDKESKIDIVVSDGKGVEKASVPSVTRMSLEDAEKEIKSSGFKVGNITYGYNESIGKGYVTYLQWQAGMMLEKGTTIDLEVSQGPEPKPEEKPAEDQQNTQNATDTTNTATETRTE